VYSRTYTVYTDARYISLTTFRKDGSAVSTPVWVVSDDGERLLVWTGASTWKVKRIRRDPHVLVAGCTFRGRERGPRVEGMARVLGPEAEAIVVPLLRRKYGWQRRALELLSRGETKPAYIEIQLTSSSREPSRRPRPNFADGLPSVTTMSPVKSFEPRMSDDPTP
jgi:uncharacterized protein